MANTQHLQQTTQPPGKVIHQKNSLRTVFRTYTVPDIAKDAIIVAATSPDMQLASPKEDGWMISDFYAFNYLLKDTCNDQTWFSVNAEQDLINQYGEYLHGSPHETRKIVLSQDILDRGDITRARTVAPTKMIDSVLKHISHSCIKAKKENLPLVLLFFCHGHATSNLILNAHNTHDCLSISRLQGVLDPAVQVTIITTACYSGGWTICTDLNTTFYAAAADEPSYAWATSHSVSARVGGSVFASTMIRSLCRSSEPLMDLFKKETSHVYSMQGNSRASRADLNKITLPRTHDFSKVETSTPEEAETLNAFIHVMNKTLEEEMSQSCKHEFHFSAMDDDWESCWARRTGLPLGRFAERWSRLQEYRGQQYREKREGLISYTDEHPDNKNYSGAVFVEERKEKEEMREQSQWEKGEGEMPTESFQERNQSAKLRGGGLANSLITVPLGIPGTQQSMGLHTFRLPPGGIRRLQYQARMLLDNCPGGSWLGTADHSLLRKLERFIENGEPTKVWEIFHTLKFRESSMEFADFVLSTCGIKPALASTRCLDWHYDGWLGWAVKNGKRGIYGTITKELIDRQCQFMPTEEQGPMFDRPRHYIAASLVNANMSKADTFKVLDDIENWFKITFQATTEGLLKHNEVQVSGKKWHTLRGGWKKAKDKLRSLSPKKKDQATENSG